MKIELLEKKINSMLASKSKVAKKDPITFYWSRKDPNLLLSIIETFCEQDDLIFDPFLGSAPILYSIDEFNKTLSVVGSEINEMPISFIKFNLQDITEDELAAINRKYRSFYDEHIHLYEYESPIYNEKITLSKLIFDRIDNEINVKEFIFADNYRLSKSDTNLGEFQSVEKNYKTRFEELTNTVKEIDVNLIENSRIAIKEGMQLSSLFNPINYFALKKFSNYFHNEPLMLNMLSSTLHLCRLTDLKSQSQFPYWVPKKDVVERNVLLVIQKRINEIIKNKRLNTLNIKLKKNFHEIEKNEKCLLILNKPSQSLTENDIPNKSIKFLITDPPYFDQVAYSEYLKIWEHICYLGSNLDEELVLSNRKVSPSSEEKYLSNLTKCFTVASSKLKDDGLAIIFFKDSKPNNIHLFLKAMEESGFDFIRSVHVGHKKFTYKQNTTQDTTVGGECLFFFNKCNEKSSTANKSAEDLKEISVVVDIEGVVYRFAAEYLKKNGEASLGELFDNGLLLILYKNDLLRKISSSKPIVEILNRSFKLLDNRNYIIG